MSQHLLPKTLRAVLEEFAKLPGVGEKTALRYCVHLLKTDPKKLEHLSTALSSLSDSIKTCPACFFWTQDERCPLCENISRSKQKICVVRDSPDVLSLEKSRSHNWAYHVLQGLLSPLNGVGPKQIRLEALFERIEDNQVTELILAFDATVEGDATAFYIRDHCKEHFPDLVLSRTSQGIPAGASVEYLDASTLESALNFRVPL